MSGPAAVAAASPAGDDGVTFVDSGGDLDDFVSADAPPSSGEASSGGDMGTGTLAAIVAAAVFLAIAGAVACVMLRSPADTKDSRELGAGGNAAGSTVVQISDPFALGDAAWAPTDPSGFGDAACPASAAFALDMDVFAQDPAPFAEPAYLATKATAHYHMAQATAVPVAI